MDWYSLILPIAYLTTLIGSLYTFSYLYRRRQTQKALSLQPWFPTHTTRNIYTTLLELQQNPTPSAPKTPDTLVRAALLRRAVTDIHRLLSLRNSKPALAQLLQRGSVGDELWQRFQVAEKEMEAELREVVEEANALAQGWGQTIFQSANEIALNEVLRRKLREVEEKRAEEKERWAERRESVREGFMKELEGGTKVDSKGEPKEESRRGSKAEAKTEQTSEVKVEETDTPQDAKTTPATPSASAPTTSPKAGSSDDDAVLVEREPNVTDTPSTPSQAGGGGVGSAKKKKGKK